MNGDHGWWVSSKSCPDDYAPSWTHFADREHAVRHIDLCKRMYPTDILELWGYDAGLMGWSRE